MRHPAAALACAAHLCCGTLAVAQFSGHTNDVWAYYVDTDEWVELHPTGTPPIPCRNHSAAYDPINQRMIVSQGVAAVTPPTSDYFYQLSLVEGSETWLPASPTSGTFPVPDDVLAGRDFYYSASLESLIYADDLAVHLWNMRTGAATSAVTATAFDLGQFHAGAVDEATSSLYTFGGGPSADVWRFTPTTATLVATTGDVPPDKYLIRSAIDPVRRKMIFFGGNSFPTFEGGDYRDHTYELDLDTHVWEEVEAASPPSARGQYAAVFDPVESNMYLFGGLFRVGPDFENVITYNELWVYNSPTQSWHKELPTTPGPDIRRMPAAVFDALNRRIVVFGGQKLQPIVTKTSMAVKLPLNGQRITGDRVTVAAEFVKGDASLLEFVQFEYRQPSITGSWAIIPAAGDFHANPQGSEPYFIHWDVTGMPEGDVDIRARAQDTSWIWDTAADEIVVTIDHINPDVKQELNDEGHVESTYVISDGMFTDIGLSDNPLAGDAREALGNVRVRIPADTFAGGTTIVTTFGSVSDYAALDGMENLGFLVELSASSQPLGAMTLIFDYPDADQDGVVDGTTFDELDMTVYTLDDMGEPEELQNVIVDPVANQVRGDVDHLSPFIVTTGGSASAVRDWMAFQD